MTDVPELKPCPFCGAAPEYTPPSEVSDLPFIACPTVLTTPEGFEECCGVSSQSVSHWNNRADLFATKDTEIAVLRAQVKTLADGLKFYQDAWNFRTNKRYGGLEWHPKEELLDDCGNTARAALTAYQQAKEADDA